MFKRAQNTLPNKLNKKLKVNMQDTKVMKNVNFLSFTMVRCIMDVLIIPLSKIQEINCGVLLKPIHQLMNIYLVYLEIQTGEFVQILIVKKLNVTKIQVIYIKIHKNLSVSMSICPFF